MEKLSILTASIFSKLMWKFNTAPNQKPNRDFPGGPVVKMPYFQDESSSPGWGSSHMLLSMAKKKIFLIQTKMLNLYKMTIHLEE